MADILVKDVDNDWYKSYKKLTIMKNASLNPRVLGAHINKKLEIDSLEDIDSIIASVEFLSILEIMNLSDCKFSDITIMYIDPWKVMWDSNKEQYYLKPNFIISYGLFKQIGFSDSYLDFRGASLKDDVVIDARNNHLDYLSPVGYHYYDKKISDYKIIVPDDVYNSYMASGYIVINFTPESIFVEEIKNGKN